MVRTKFSKIIDVISLTISVFILSYWLLKATNLTLTPKILISCFISIITTCTILKILKMKSQRHTIKQLDKDNSLKIQNALKFGDPEKLEQFWIKLFSKKYIVQNHKSHLTLKNSIKTINFYYSFTSDEIPLEKIIKLTSLHNNELICFCANSFSSDAILLVNSHKNIQLLDLNATIAIIKKYNLQPTLNNSQTTKNSLFKKVLSTINKINTLKFIKYAFFLLLIGVFFQKNITYIIFSIILFIIAIISFIKQPHPNHKNIDI